MVELRNDIFINLKDNTRQTTIEKYYVDEAFEAMGHLFDNKDKFVDYLNSIKNPADAELFVRMSSFYLIAKKYEKSIPAKLIMIISIIERISNKNRDFITMDNWIINQDNKIREYLSKYEEVSMEQFKEVFELLREDYFKIFGSQRNFFAFFKTVSLDDKIKIIKSFKTQRVKIVEGVFAKYFEERLKPFTTIDEFEIAEKRKLKHAQMPECYHWKSCYLGYGQCSDKISCWLHDNPDEVDSYLKKTIRLIYQMRSNFVHNAKLFLLNEKDSIFLADSIDGDTVFIELTVEDFQDIFERTFKKYFHT